MKPIAQILTALWNAFIPGGDYSPLVRTLFVVGRILVSLAIIPSIMMSVMLSDSGTEASGWAALTMMYVISLLFWAVLLWSWRCAAAFALNLALMILVMSLSSDDGVGTALSIQLLFVSTLVITELLARPIRTICGFLGWCCSNEGLPAQTFDDNNSGGVYYEDQPKKDNKESQQGIGMV